MFFRFFASFVDRSKCVRVAAVVCLTSSMTVTTQADEKATFAPVESFLQKHCVACHGERDAKAGLSLVKFRTPLDVVRQRKAWDGVVTMVEAGEMPPADKPQPTADERAAFLAAVEKIFVDHERNAPPNPGRVTMRRLNRAEYNNTIRDLFYGLDVNASEDFPSDDVGHGFDNIGDVLTMSPVLMERYLAAAENVSRRVLVADAAKPGSRGIAMQYTQPSSAKVPLAGAYRILSTKAGGQPFETGPVFSQFVLNPYDEYVFKFSCYAQRDADDKSNEPIRVVAFVRGKDPVEGAKSPEIEQLWGALVPNVRPFHLLGTFEIKAREAKKAESFTVKIPPTEAVEYVGVALLKPKQENAAEARLFLKFQSLDGPLDTRPYAMRRLVDPFRDLAPAERTRAMLTHFATRAYRRPATAAEVDRLVKIVAGVEADGGKWESGVQLAIQSVLASPKFVFRAELDDRPQAADVRSLDEYQLASRLSYFLWSSMPDDELFELAAKKQLAANLDAQVRRMLADPKSRALVEEFAMQWLQLERLRTHSVDPVRFPSFNDLLRQAMIKETQLFLEAIIREDRSILEMIDADFTFLNRTLADHYGIADTVGNGKKQKTKVPGGKQFRGPTIWERVQLQDRRRGGLLTQASVLTVSSNPTRTSPVKRGKWVLEQLLGAPPPPPPANVPELEQQKDQLTGTLRQQMEQHRQNPACANCHAKMDPLGFAFENFDAIGAYRETDGEQTIDASGTLPDGRSFNGPVELRSILKEKKAEFTRCLTEKLLTFALGRGLEYYDRRAIDQIVAAVEKNDYKFSTLCSEIARSEPFRKRRGPDEAAAASAP
jgi:mono/diheme cytochrome c family protein